MRIELLSPARNLTQGISAINHGADAVYIGAPAFGARQAATNTVADIEKLARYAHLYGARVYVTLNTILFDNELEAAVRLIYELYDIGIDALIIQDMGLLECSLPPIALHASTQTHNYSIEKVRFLEQVGFKRVILARETSIDKMQAIKQQTLVELEAFVHGALCVSFSGQCYMSQYLTGRSGNRGCCTQPCRSRYNLVNADGKELQHDKHLLSLRDLNASQHIADMIDAGICSFKIEGRLKDEAYVRNITAYYRQIIDDILEQKRQHKPLSSGKTTFFFTPDPDRTFSRRFTDYFIKSRQPMATFDTQKSMGKLVAKILKVERGAVVADIYDPISVGDGLCAYDNSRGEVYGFLINRVEGNRLFPNNIPPLKEGMELWRNRDVRFERLFNGHTSERKVDIHLCLRETATGFHLKAWDAAGCEAEVEMVYDKELAHNLEKLRESIDTQLRKLGGTAFCAASVSIDKSVKSFIATSAVNQMRRDVINLLIAERERFFKPKPTTRKPGNTDEIQYCCGPVDYRLNVGNAKAESFYRRHGVDDIEYGLEVTQNYDGKALMTTKYCLRYELGQCLKMKNHPNADKNYQKDLFLENNGRRFALKFDCDACEMLIYKS